MANVRTVLGCTADTDVARTVPVELIRSAVTTYPVIGDPPEAGADQFAVAVMAPPVTPDAAVPIPGVPGTVAGVTAGVLGEAVPAPTPLFAVTSKLYELPLARPVTVKARAVAPTV